MRTLKRVLLMGRYLLTFAVIAGVIIGVKLYADVFSVHHPLAYNIIGLCVMIPFGIFIAGLFLYGLHDIWKSTAEKV